MRPQVSRDLCFVGNKDGGASLAMNGLAHLPSTRKRLHTLRVPYLTTPFSTLQAVRPLIEWPRILKSP